MSCCGSELVVSEGVKGKNTNELYILFYMPVISIPLYTLPLSALSFPQYILVSLSLSIFPPFILFQLSRYSDWATGWTVRDRIPVGTRFSAPVQTGPGAHPASCTIGTGFFLGVKCGRSVLLTTHPLLVRSWKSRAITLPTLWATPGL